MHGFRAGRQHNQSPPGAPAARRSPPNGCRMGRRDQPRACLSVCGVQARAGTPAAGVSQSRWPATTLTCNRDEWEEPNGRCDPRVGAQHKGGLHGMQTPGASVAPRLTCPGRGGPGRGQATSVLTVLKFWYHQTPGFVDLWICWFVRLWDLGLCVVGWQRCVAGGGTAPCSTAELHDAPSGTMLIFRGIQTARRIPMPAPASTSATYWHQRHMRPSPTLCPASCHHVQSFPPSHSPCQLLEASMLAVFVS